MFENYNNFVKEKIREYSIQNVVFPKKNYQWLLLRIRKTKREFFVMLFKSRIEYAEMQLRIFQNKREIRYKCIFVISDLETYCVVLSFDKSLNIFTIFPIGQKSFQKIKRKYI